MWSNCHLEYVYNADAFGYAVRVILCVGHRPTTAQDA